jgi:hypothetical protein
MMGVRAKKPTSPLPIAGRHRDTRRRYALRLLLETLEHRLIPVSGLTSIGPGAYIIEMGQATQTVANSLKQHGTVHDLVQDQHAPGRLGQRPP